MQLSNIPSQHELVNSQASPSRLHCCLAPHTLPHPNRIFYSVFSPISPPLRSLLFCYQPALSFLHLIAHAILTSFLDIWCQRILWGGSLKRDPDPDPVTRFVPYALRRNSRTRQTTSRKAQGLLKRKYPLKREVQSVTQCVSPRAFIFLGGRGLEMRYLQCRWYYDDMISWSWTKGKGKTAEPYPGGEGLSHIHPASWFWPVSCVTWRSKRQPKAIYSVSRPWLVSHTHSLPWS